MNKNSIKKQETRMKKQKEISNYTRKRNVIERKRNKK
jgi:hypothetical protein